MAKKSDEAYRYLVARRVGKQVDALAAQLDGCRVGEDIECIHQARVASRRLRTVLAMGGDCFGAKKAKRWGKVLKRLARALGRARDLDVAAALLSETLDSLTDKPSRPGVARMLLRTRQQREVCQGAVVKAIDRFERSKVAPDLNAASRRILSAFRRHRRKPKPSPAVFAWAARHVARRYKQLAGYRNCLNDPNDVASHHAMRIAAKRFRYTLETCRPAYGKDLDAAIDAAKKAQTLLGEIHDCDVWAEQLTGFEVEEMNRTVEYFGHTRSFARLRPGIVYLANNRRRRRKKAFAELVQYWRQLERQGVWSRMMEWVRVRAESGADAPVNSPQPIEDDLEVRS